MADGFSITSPQLKDGARLAEAQAFSLYGCHGANLSPALQWQAPPAGTKSFAVTLFDLDVPGGGEWWHWIIFNIPAHVSGLVEGAGSPQAHLAPPEAIQIRNDFGKPGYGGPCPPPGDPPHRYEFSVYALNTDTLPLNEQSPAATVSYYLQQHALARAVLRVTYSR